MQRDIERCTMKQQVTTLYKVLPTLVHVFKLDLQCNRLDISKRDCVDTLYSNDLIAANSVDKCTFHEDVYCVKCITPMGFYGRCCIAVMDLECVDDIAEE